MSRVVSVAAIGRCTGAPEARDQWPDASRRGDGVQPPAAHRSVLPATHEGTDGKGGQKRGQLGARVGSRDLYHSFIQIIQSIVRSIIQSFIDIFYNVLNTGMFPVGTPAERH